MTPSDISASGLTSMCLNMTSSFYCTLIDFSNFSNLVTVYLPCTIRTADTQRSAQQALEPVWCSDSIQQQSSQTFSVQNDALTLKRSGNLHLQRGAHPYRERKPAKVWVIHVQQMSNHSPSISGSSASVAVKCEAGNPVDFRFEYICLHSQTITGNLHNNLKRVE